MLLHFLNCQFPSCVGYIIDLFIVCAAHPRCFSVCGTSSMFKSHHEFGWIANDPMMLRGLFCVSIRPDSWRRKKMNWNISNSFTRSNYNWWRRRCVHHKLASSQTVPFLDLKTRFGCMNLCFITHQILAYLWWYLQNVAFRSTNTDTCSHHRRMVKNPLNTLNLKHFYTFLSSLWCYCTCFRLKMICSLWCLHGHMKCSIYKYNCLHKLDNRGGDYAASSASSD